MRLTSQGEHAHIRPSPKSSPADVGYYIIAYLLLSYLLVFSAHKLIRLCSHITKIQFMPFY
jgi:hypothetical protein